MNILWLSDSPMTVTGYSTISWNICNKLAEAGHNVYYLAHNYMGQTLAKGKHIENGPEFKFITLGGSPTAYSQNLIMPFIKKYKIDVFGILLDTFMTYPWLLNLDFAPAKTIFYYPSDGGGGLPLRCEDILKKVNVPIAMARFGQRQVKQLHQMDTKYIPHAVDIKNYYPLSPEEKLKCKAKFGLQDKYVVGVVARNQGRKMLDRTIKSFSMFAKGGIQCTCGHIRELTETECPNKNQDNTYLKLLFDKMGIKPTTFHADLCKHEPHPDAMLFMHTDPTDVATPFDISQLIIRYKLQNRVLFSGMTFYNGFDYKQMNEVYGAMDCFFLTTSGEGFGIPIIEAMACGIPPIVTDYTTTQELLIEDGECGLPVKLASELTGSWNVERGIMDDEDGCRCLKKLYDEPELRKQFAKVGIEKVKKIYNWDTVGKQWTDLMEELK